MRKTTVNTERAWVDRQQVCDDASDDLRGIAFALRASGAVQAAKAVRRAMKSVDGASRHASRMRVEAGERQL